MNYIPGSVEKQVMVDAEKDVAAPAAHENTSKRSPKTMMVQDSGKKSDKEGQPQMTEDEQVLHEELEKMIAQEVVAKALDDATRQAFKEKKRNIASQKRAAQTNSITKLSTTVSMHSHPRRTQEPYHNSLTRYKLWVKANDAKGIAKVQINKYYILVDFAHLEKLAIAQSGSLLRIKGMREVLEVYVDQPLGFVDPAHPNKVYKVIKALYGLHQAPKAIKPLEKIPLRRERIEKRGIGLMGGERKGSSPSLCSSLYITAKVVGKPVNISEASIRSDLLFDDADGIDSLHNQAIFDAIQLMGSKVLHFSERPLKPTTPTPPYPSADQYETQPDPSPKPLPTIPIPDSIPEGSGGNHGGHSSSDRSLSGNEDSLTTLKLKWIFLCLYVIGP
ncbi:putative ribonuclease H-like domain-containing protein [Tanacetum coccineum]